MLYKMPTSCSSKIFAKRVFWRLRNQILDGHISGLEQDRYNLKPLLPTKSPTPYRLVPLASRSRDHTTSGLAFLASRSHTNRRKRYRGNENNLRHVVAGAKGYKDKYWSLGTNWGYRGGKGGICRIFEVFSKFGVP